MTSSALGSEPSLAVSAWCRGDRLYVELTDGRVVTHPLPDWVLAAPPAKRRCQVEEFGTAIWWPEIDEGIGVNSLFGVSEAVVEDLAGFEPGPFETSRTK